MPALAETTENQQLEKLQQQMTQLQQEVSTLKTQPIKHHTIAKKKIATKHPATQGPTIQTNLPLAQPNAPLISGPIGLPQSGTSYLPIDLDVPGQAFVSTGPYLGVPLQYAGGDLIINNPTIYEDVALLRLRQNINKRLAELGVPHQENHAHLLLSGLVQAQGNYKEGGIAPASSDFDVTSVNLEAYILGPSTWTSGLISFAYQNDIGSSSGTVTTNYRVYNSRVYINEAFAIIGDLAKSPIYTTIGQMYVPFGKYNTNLVTNPVTKTMARTKARALLLGYRGQATNDFYGAAYIFRGDTYFASSYRKIDNGGIDVGYHFRNDKMNGDFGAGVIANMADAVGMQITGNFPLFSGFGSTFTSCSSGTGICGSEQLVHRVPAYDMRGLLAIGEHWDLLGEYIIAATSFNPNDLSYNGNGAEPRALNLEGAYTFSAFARPNTIALGYAMTQEALAIGLPAKRYSLVFNTSIWRETLQSLELRHDINYSGSATSSGSGVPGPTGTGTSDNVITAQFSIYF